MANLVTVDTDAQVVTLIPSAINMVLMVNDNVVSNLRRGLTTDLSLPSLYRKAFLVVNETDEISAIVQGRTK
jgi:hypothetical protein